MTKEITPGELTTRRYTTEEDDQAVRHVFGAELGRKLAARTGGLDARERCFNERERALSASEQRLRAVQRLIRVEQLPLASNRNVERDERCPCQSGLKFKHCHGLAGRRT